MALENLRAAAERAGIPTGLAQQAQGPQGGGGGPQGGGALDQINNFGQSWGLPAWQTGGQTGSTRNGFNTDFFDRMFKQQNEVVDSGRGDQWYDRDDFTGVAFYDRNGKRDVKFGDIYDGGVRVGNLYEDQNLSQEQADMMMGRLMLGSDVSRVKNPADLSKEVQRQRKEYEKEAAHGVTARQFEERVEKQKDEWEADGNVGWHNAAGFVSGLAGGAVTGARLGPWGAIGGAIVGGVGSLLNQDESNDAIARATVQTQMAAESGNIGSAIGTGLESFGAYALGRIDPVGQLTRGLYDTIHGEVGDGKSAWYEVDPVTGESDRAWGWDVANIGGMAISGFGAGATKMGRNVLMGSMGTAVGGGVTQLTLGGGETFDDRRGDFDNVYFDEEGNFDLGSAAAGVGAVGFDALQMASFKGLFNAADSTVRMFSRGAGEAVEAAKPGMWARLRDKVQNTDRVEIGGFSYRLDEAGRAIDGSRRASAGLFAPSEMLQGASSAMMTRMRAARTGSTGRPTADDYYQMSVALGNGQKPWTGIAVNALGEGYEEGMQAILEPLSHNSSFDLNEVLQSALMGAAFGGGISGATTLNSIRGDKALRAQANWAQAARGERPIDDKQWKSMSQEEKRALVVMPDAHKAAFRAALENAAADQQLDFVAKTPAAERRFGEAMKERAIADTKASADKTDVSLRITQTDDARVPGNAVVGSMNRVKAMFESHVQGLDLAVETEQDPALKEQLAAAAVEARKLVEWVEASRRNYATSTTLQERRDVVDGINRVIKAFFDGTVTNELPEEGAMARARAATIVHVRHPIDNAGSFSAFMPQVDSRLTEAEADQVLEIGHSSITPLGADFDGDKISNAARFVMNEASFKASRQGFGSVQLSGEIANDVRQYEESHIILIGQSMSQAPTSGEHIAATAAIASIKRRLMARYGEIPGFEGLLDSGLRRLEAGDKKARTKLLQDLSVNLADEILAVDPLQISNEWLHIDQVFQQELQQFNFETAGRIKPNTVRTSTAMPIDATSESFTRRQAAGASEGASLGQTTQGSDLFRAFQKLQYVVFRTGIDTETGANNPEMHQLMGLYQLMNANLSEDALAQAAGQDEVLIRTQAKIAQFARMIDRPHAEAAVANMMMPNVDSRGVSYATGNNREHISVAQWFLREEVLAAQSRFGDILEADTTFARRLEFLMSLTQPQDGRGKKENRSALGTRAGAAFVEIYQEVPLYNLVGEDALTFGADLTVGQYARALFDKGWRARSTERELLMQGPQYYGRKQEANLPFTSEFISKQGDVNLSYRSVVDSLLDFVDHKLSVVREGMEAGEPRGELADRSNRVGRELRESVALIQDAMRSFAGREGREIDREGVQRFLMENSSLDTAVHALINDTAANAFFKRDPKTNTLYSAPWLIDALTMEPAKAELHILLNLSLATYNGKLSTRSNPEDTKKHGREYSKLTDRLHRIMYNVTSRDVTDTGLDHFFQDVSRAEDVAELERIINTKYIAESEPPFVAWVRDTAEFDATFANGGWGEVLDGASEREAIATLKSRASSLNELLAREQKYMVREANAVRVLQDALAAERRGELDPNSELGQAWNRLGLAIGAAQNTPPLISPQATRDALRGAYRAFYQQATDKGKTAPPFMGLGVFDAALESFGITYEATLASLGSYDIDTLMTLPGLAARGELRTTDHDGSPVTLPKLTPEFIIENLENQQFRSYIYTLLTPSVWGTDPDTGALKIEHLVEPSIAAIIDPANEANTSLYAPENADLYLTRLDGALRTNDDRRPLTTIMSDLGIAMINSLPSGLKGFSEDQLYTHVSRKVARVIQALGDLTARRTPVVDPVTGEIRATGLTTEVNGEIVDEYEAARLALKSALRARYTANLFPEIDDLMSHAEIREQLENNLIEARLMAVRTATKKGDLHTLSLQSSRDAELAAAVASGNVVDAAIALYRYDPADPDAAERRRQLHAVVKMNPNLVNHAQWADAPLRKALDAGGSMILDPDTGLPALTDAEWTIISRVLAGQFIEHASGVPAGDQVQLPIFPDYTTEQGRRELRSWDPTHAAVIDQLFSKEIIAAAAELHRDSSRKTTTTLNSFSELLIREFLPERKDGKFEPELGRWTVDVPLLAKAADDRIISPAAQPMISQAGVAPKRNWINLAWRRSFEKPVFDETTLTALESSAAGLLSGDELYYMAAVTRPSGATGHVSPASLNGRFASGASLTLPDGSEVDLWQAVNAPQLGAVWGNDPAGAHPELRAITLQQLRAAIKRATKDLTAEDLEKVQVRVSYLHPDDAPVGQPGNVYYAGLVGENVTGDAYPSANEAMWFAPDGLNRTAQQEALSAAKTGDNASMLALTYSPEDLRRFETGWQTNYSAMLERKTLAQMHADNGHGPLAGVFYNGVALGVRRGHFVRGISKESGQPVLWTSEQVIDWQQQNPGASIDTIMDHAELYVPSASVLRTLYGDRRSQASQTLLDEVPAVEYSQLPAYDGTVTERALRALPGILRTAEGGGWATKGALETLLAGRVGRAQYTGREMNETVLPQPHVERMRRNNALADSIRQARFAENQESNLQAIREKASDRLTLPETVGDSVIHWNRLGAAYVPTPAVWEQHMAKALNRAASSGIELGDYDMKWVLRENPGNEGVLDAVLSGDTLTNPPSMAFSVSPRDLVGVLVDDFADNLEVAKRRLDFLMERGVTIQLVSPGNRRNDVGILAQYIRESSIYKAVSRELFVVDYQGSGTPNVRARETSLSVESTLDPSNLNLVLRVEGKELGENAALSGVEVASDLSNEVLVRTAMIPTHGFEDFAVPTDPRSVKLVKDQITGLLDPDAFDGGADFLAELAGVRTAEERAAWDRDVEELLSRWTDSPNEDGMYPVKELRRGVIIPRLRRTADGTQLFLSRYGHKDPSRDELEAMFRRDAGGDGAGSNFGVSKPVELGTEATVLEGTIVSRKRNNRFGMSATVRVPLRLVGGKMQLELAGYKVTVRPRNEDVIALPQSAVLPNMPINLIVDEAGIAKKNSNEGLINSHRDAFAAIGIDFTEEIVRFFTGVGRDAGAKFATAESRTRSLLDEIGRFIPKMSQRDLVEAQYTRTMPKHVLDALSQMRINTASGVRDFDTLLLELADPSALTSDQQIADASIAQAVLGYMMSPVDSGDSRYTNVPAFMRVLSTPGVHARSATTTKAVSQYMAPSFTGFFDQMEYAHPARQHILDKLRARAESVAPDGSGFHLNPDFSYNVIPDAADHRKNYTARLQLVEAHSSGDNPTTDAISNDRGSRQDNSETAQSLANLTGLNRIALEQGNRRAELWDPRVHEIVNVQSFRDMMRDIPEEAPAARRTQLNPEEKMYIRLASEVAGDFRQELETEYWKEGRTKQEYNLAVEQFTDKIAELARKTGLSKYQRAHFHYWIRQNLGMPKASASVDPNSPEGKAGRVSFEKAMDALAQIEYNLENGWLPTTDAEVPMIHHIDLAALYQAAERKGGLQLRLSIDDPTARAESWNDWLSVALAMGETKDNVYDAMFLTATDGMMQSYLHRERSLIGLPVTRDALRQQKLYSEDTQQLVLSIDPTRAATMSSPTFLQDKYAEFGAMFGAHYSGVRWESSGAPTRARDQRRAARAQLREKGKIAFPQKTNIRNFREYGAVWMKEQSTSTAVARIAMDLRVGTALINPLLWMGAAYELGIRSTLEAASNALAGGNLGTAGGRALSNLSEKTGITLNVYTPEQQARFGQLNQALGSRPEFKGMLYGSLMYQQETGQFNIIERTTKRLARIGSFMQDPTWGVKGTALARRYVEAVVQWRDAAGTAINVSDDALITGLMGDPTWVQKNMPAAHAAALATIANNRSLKPTPVSLALQGIYEPLSQHPSSLVSTASTLILKVPMVFSGYIANFATNILGLQGPMAFISTHLHARSGKLPGISSWLAGEGYDKDAQYDMSRAIEGLDLSKAFIQSGMTHTLLFAAGMAAGGLGIGTGGDEEERRRRRAAMYQRMPYAYDPRDIINDFRNADAVYLDWLPFGLNKLFTIPNPDGTNSSESMAQVPWYLRQFVSPILGMEKFFMTGDMRHIGWGFKDAIGSMPLVNAQMWDDANRTVARLMESAPDADTAEELDTALEGYKLGIQILSVYESMLFENSFINSLYVGSDQWDRDNWKIPLTDSDGVTQVDALKNPRTTTALQDTVDSETGEMRQSTLSRNVWDATLHGFTEKRLTLALASMLFTGGTSLRQNQVVKTRTIDKEVLDLDAAGAAVMGLYRNATGGAPEMTADTGSSWILSGYDQLGRETLNNEGAHAVIRGIWKGSMTLGSDGLQGLYIPFEMREQLQAELMEGLIQEGMDLGLSEYDAKGRMYDVWYGPKNVPGAIGLKDVVWSDQISYKPSDKYYQLNTTYIIGPDGKPWATNVTRDNLQTLFGFAPLNRYMVGDMVEEQDGALNTTDSLSGVNTGMRGLVKTDESWMIPTDVEIGESMEKALKEAIDKAYSSNTDGDGNGNGGYGRGYGYSRRGGYSRGGGGYGGGGGSYAYKLNGPERMNPIYANKDPYIRVDNPIIRRADIRRERYSSTRGRLNQWQ